jgi:hypothetical protein
MCGEKPSSTHKCILLVNNLERLIKTPRIQTLKDFSVNPAPGLPGSSARSSAVQRRNPLEPIRKIKEVEKKDVSRYK